ncbi:MAG: hypothetical protein DWH78_08300 [Planctomycetota bacterium]|jgi:hypothetical protein|nr:MAG: hypothetical protein DWH78_08300 [Planctomycetota bacterium]
MNFEESALLECSTAPEVRQASGTILAKFRKGAFSTVIDSLLVARDREDILLFRSFRPDLGGEARI